MKRQASQVSAVVFLTALALAGWVALGTQAQDKAEIKDEKPAAAAQPGGAQIEQMIAELKAIGELIKQLDSDKFATRQQASDQLVQLGPPVREPLRRVLANQPGLEVATRIESILREVEKRESEEEKKSKKLRASLAQPVNLDKGIDAHTPLKDALDFLADRYDLTILFDTAAFEAIGVQKPQEQPVQLPRMVGVKLEVVLKMLLAQVKGDDGCGAYVVLADHILITTTAAEQYSANREPLRRGRVRTATVQFDRRPIGAALRELAAAQGLNIVLDNRQEKLLEKLVTADFQQVPLDTIVRLLTDMADLRTVPIDNTLYVTSPDNARALQAEQDKVKAQEAQLLREQAAPPRQD